MARGDRGEGLHSVRKNGGRGSYSEGEEEEARSLIKKKYLF